MARIDEERADEFFRLAKEAKGEQPQYKAISLSWEQVVKGLLEKSDTRHIYEHNKQLKQLLFEGEGGLIKMAELLLFREFRRRPKRQNSLETQGLVRVSYKNLESATQLPEGWEQHNLSVQDWQDFLKVALDFFGAGKYINAGRLRLERVGRYTIF